MYSGSVGQRLRCREAFILNTKDDFLREEIAGIITTAANQGNGNDTIPSDERLFLLGDTLMHDPVSRNATDALTVGLFSMPARNKTTVARNTDLRVPLVIKIGAMASQEDNGMKLNLQDVTCSMGTSAWLT